MPPVAALRGGVSGCVWIRALGWGRAGWAGLGWAGLGWLVACWPGERALAAGGPRTGPTQLPAERFVQTTGRPCAPPRPTPPPLQVPLVHRVLASGLRPDPAGLNNQGQPHVAVAAVNGHVGVLDLLCASGGAVTLKALHHATDMRSLRVRGPAGQQCGAMAGLGGRVLRCGEASRSAGGGRRAVCVCELPPTCTSARPCAPARLLARRDCSCCWHAGGRRC